MKKINRREQEAKHTHFLMERAVPVKRRRNTKHIKTFPASERCVAMCEYKGDIYVATEKRVYIMVEDKLRPLEIVKVTKKADGVLL